MMTEEEFKEQAENALYQSFQRLVILYILPDIIEALMLDIDEYRAKAFQPPLRMNQKYYWKGLLKNVRGLREFLKVEDMDTQVEFANSCEMIQKLIMYAVDRSGEDDLTMQRFIDYIKSFPSKRNIEIRD